MYYCPICKTSDSKFISVVNNKSYCRRCVTFTEIIKDKYKPPDKVILDINYELTPLQKQLSKEILLAFKKQKNVLINAVCGAGKTELVFEVIKYCLENKKQVGFTVPRKDVVIDLYPRFKNAFPLQKVISVYGNHHEELIGNIIILTTHQLYRYEKYFDLLIIDEADAFPYYGNELLINLFYRSLKGNYVMMSATPLQEMIDNINREKGIILSCNKRYHNKPLPVPIIKTFLIGKHLYLVFKVGLFIKDNKPLLIFTPTIEECEKIYLLLHKIFKNGNYVHSKKDDRDKIIEDFKNKKYNYLVTTSILERGVTLKNIQVIVFNAHNDLFDKKTLVQIAGRVGRKIDAWLGEVIYISDYISEAMNESISHINIMNE